MNKGTNKPLIAVGILGVFAVGLIVGQSDFFAAADSRLDDLNTVSKDQFAPFWKAWIILNQKFVTAASTTPQDKIWSSIQGLASSYKDPYTVFFPPEESKMFQEDIAGNFEGVGMEIGIKNKQLQVVSPLKNSPAYRAGVKPGDLILKIDGRDSALMSVDQAVKLIRGRKGTVVKILFVPANNSKPVEKSIIRDLIDIPTIETAVKSSNSSRVSASTTAGMNNASSSTGAKDISVIRLYSFSAQSPDLFRQALRDFVLTGNRKLILDLRGNPGGYLDAAWDMASWFMPAGKIVVTEDFGKNAGPQIYRSKGYNIFNDKLRMIVLVDNGSASAAEILAGALQEQGIAKLVGVKTFGKGSVQELVPITSDTSLKITIARWLTPNGHNLSHDGLDPDYNVPITDKDLAAGKDPQMDKAVSLLSN